MTSLSIKPVSPKTLFVILSAALCFATVAYHFVGSRYNQSFLRFERLPWTDSIRCKFEGSVKANELICQSKEFAIDGNVIEIFTKNSISLHAELFSKNRKVSTSVIPRRVFSDSDSKYWFSYKFFFPQKTPPQSLQLYISSLESNPNAQVEIKGRVNLFSESAPSRSLFAQVLASFCWGLGILIVVGAWWKLGITSSYLPFLFLALSTAMFFRRGLYFLFDEWAMLYRYSHQGYISAFLPHNEHFIPLFNLVYFAELSIFGTNHYAFLLISLLIHSLSAYVLYLIVLYLLQGKKVASLCAFILSVGYALNSLHTESLQWSMVQSALLSNLFCLISILFGIKYLRFKTNKVLWLSAIFHILSALSFGGGLVSIAYIAIISLLYCLQNEISVGTIRRLILMHGITCLFVTSIYLGLPFLLTNQESFEAISSHFVLSFKPTLDYLLTGGELGTVARGLGVFPALQLRAPFLFGLYVGVEYGAIDVSLGLIATVLSVLILCLYLKLKAPKGFIYWASGQAYIFCSLALPAISRWPLGNFQSLALRYQTFALTGLVLMLIPATIMVCSNWQNIKAGGRYLCLVVACLYFGIHAWMCLRYTRYIDNSLYARSYIAQLKQWQEELKNENKAPDHAKGYLSDRPELKDLEPAQDRDFTDGLAPYHVLDTTNRLGM